MIAADTSTWVALLEGQPGEDVERLAQALGGRAASMIPAVLAELLSNPELPPAAAALLIALPEAGVHAGYWERAGLLRARVLAQGRKARLGDALIAQSCLDHDLPLLTRDRDFLAFAAAGSLKLALP